LTLTFHMTIPIEIIDYIFTFFDVKTRIKYSLLSSSYYNNSNIQDLTDIDEHLIDKLNNNILKQKKFNNLKKIRLNHNSINYIKLDNFKLSKLILNPQFSSKYNYFTNDRINSLVHHYINNNGYKLINSTQYHLNENYNLKYYSFVILAEKNFNRQQIQFIINNDLNLKQKKYEDNIYPMPYSENHYLSLDYLFNSIYHSMFSLRQPSNGDIEYVKIEILPEVNLYSVIYKKNGYDITLNFTLTRKMKKKYIVYIILNPLIIQNDIYFNPVKFIKIINLKLYVSENLICGMYDYEIDGIYQRDIIDFNNVFRPINKWIDFRTLTYNCFNVYDLKIVHINEQQ